LIVARDGSKLTAGVYGLFGQGDEFSGSAGGAVAIENLCIFVKPMGW